MVFLQKAQLHSYLLISSPDVGHKPLMVVSEQPGPCLFGGGSLPATPVATVVGLGKGGMWLLHRFVLVVLPLNHFNTFGGQMTSRATALLSL